MTPSENQNRTEQNLWDAFAGESQANRKYLAYAKQADKEGHRAVAALFRAAAAAETVHAHSHLRVLGKVKDTATNLKDAIEGETHEFTSMYPKMIEEAEAEGNKAAVRTFSLANTVEHTHAELFKKALELLGNPREAVYWVCEVCGHTHEGDEAPEKCPVCGALMKAFQRID